MTKKEKLISAAKDLMLDKGYVATTVDDICESAGVTKGSFFYYFKDKEALAKAALFDFACCADEAICCDLPKEEADPLKRVYNYLDNVIRWSNDPKMKGCLIGMFSQELSETHPAIRKLCEKVFNSQIDSMVADLTAAKKKYIPRSKVDPRQLAEHFLALAQGSNILVKVKQDRNLLERNLNQYRHYLKTIFGR